MSGNYYEKYLKYKNKYLQITGGIQKHFLRGGNENSSINNTIAIIELYNKAFNSYIVYRFRFPNAKPIIKDFEGGSLVQLSNLVLQKKNDEQIKAVFSQYYAKDLTNMNDRNIILFTLRQDTTKVIKSMLLLDNDAKIQIKQLKNLLISKQNEIKNDPNGEADYIELMGKCDLIETMADPITKATFTEAINPQGLDILRQLTNKIIMLIANGKKDGNIELSACANEDLDNLFRECFKLINIELNKL